MQLVAYGAQDVYLTGNPQITFFKVVYRRHTNFSTESIQQTLNGTVGFGNRVSCTVSRNGDLVSACVLEVDLPAPGNSKNYMACVGERLIEEVEVEIGGKSHEVLANVSGKMRMHFIKILPGDVVTLEISPYDLTRGRITYRQK